MPPLVCCCRATIWIEGGMACWCQRKTARVKTQNHHSLSAYWAAPLCLVIEGWCHSLCAPVSAGLQNAQNGLFQGGKAVLLEIQSNHSCLSASDIVSQSPSAVPQLLFPCVRGESKCREQHLFSTRSVRWSSPPSSPLLGAHSQTFTLAFTGHPAWHMHYVWAVLQTQWIMRRLSGGLSSIDDAFPSM